MNIKSEKIQDKNIIETKKVNIYTKQENTKEEKYIQNKTQKYDKNIIGKYEKEKKEAQKINDINKNNIIKATQISKKEPQIKKQVIKCEEKDNKSKSLQKIDINKQINEKEEKNKIQNNRLITSKSYKNIEN